jgi:hypothetical protein
LQEADGSWPIVWTRARGTRVTDSKGRRYLDLTAAFGVAAAGHANPRVVRAGQRQMSTLLHAMGDVHPHPLKATLARELSRITFERWSRSNRNRPRLTGKNHFWHIRIRGRGNGPETARLAAAGRPGSSHFRAVTIGSGMAH